MDRDALAAHLEFFRELGADGVSRDPQWRDRADRGPVPRHGVTAAADAGAPVTDAHSGAAPAAAASARR